MMNKKEIEDICNGYVTFRIKTNNYESGTLNTDMLEFVKDNILIIKEGKHETVIQVKDIRLIRGTLL